MAPPLSLTVTADVGIRMRRKFRIRMKRGFIDTSEWDNPLAE